MTAPNLTPAQGEALRQVALGKVAHFAGGTWIGIDPRDGRFLRRAGLIVAKPRGHGLQDLTPAGREALEAWERKQ